MHTDPTFLQGLWFVLIGVLWAGFFVLEGFDFGVGMLLKVLGRDPAETRAIIHTIGPVWDGNEVWLLTAGGATFAAFPAWYATAFSGFYLALFLVLAALIVRGISFEFWGKVEDPRWRTTWEWALAISSGVAALLFGVAWANFIHGVPMGADHVVHASLFDLLHPYALVGGLTTLALFFAHGAGFLSLRTTSDLHDRAAAVASRAAPVAALVTVVFLAWTAAGLSFAPGRLALAILAALAAGAMPIVRRTRGEGAGFVAGTVTVVLLAAVLAAALFPNAVPSSTSHAFDLTLAAAASGHYTLTVMTVVAVIVVPIVLAYTAWTYWVFRHRLGREDFTGAGTPTPLAVYDQKFGHDGRAAQPAGGNVAAGS
jgi:cytochrome d ubiquinol oxidase subunit II